MQEGCETAKRGSGAERGHMRLVEVPGGVMKININDQAEGREGRISK